MAQSSQKIITLPVLILSALCVAGALWWARAQRPSIPSVSGYELESIFGDVQLFSSAQKTWMKPSRGQAVYPGDSIKTGPEAEAEIKIPAVVRLRLKSGSEVVFPPDSHDGTGPAYRLSLKQGELFGATETETLPHPIAVESGSVYAVSTQGTTFLISQTGLQDGMLGVLKGEMSLRNRRGRAYASLHAMEKILMGPSSVEPLPMTIDRKDWGKLQEAYELIQTTAASEAQQLDMSKEAGNFFDFVFDHGTFYTPKIGYAHRDFKKDPLSGEVYLEIEYDVFPVGSFSGMYIKTRDLDLSKYKSLRFMARRHPKERGYPDSFKIEIKTLGAVARGFIAKHFERDWNVYDFPLNFTKPVDIRELAFVFLQERIGGYSKGFLQLKNFTLIPKEHISELPVQSSAEKETPAVPSRPETAKTSESVI